MDFSLYPCREYQLGWLRMFLEARYEDSGCSVTDTDVERLYVQVNKFALVCFVVGNYKSSISVCRVISRRLR